MSQPTNSLKPREPLRVASFGEALWDCVPAGLFLGGAPLNVAYHAARLGTQALPITCVGKDFLGEQCIARAKAAGMNCSLISQHERLDTGVAIARIDPKGNATYDIRMPAAWDEIALDEEALRLAGSCDALIYGSLATRSHQNRDTLETLLARTQALKVCDVNLRAPFDDLKRAARFAQMADIVKLNEEELLAFARRAPLEDALRACAATLGVSTIVATLGAQGAICIRDGVVHAARPRPVDVVDTIGAGDAFTAGLVVALLQGRAIEDALAAAITLGSFVASRHGAQPKYVRAELEA